MLDTIVVTGASSYLGQRAVAQLAGLGRYRVVALVSPRAPSDPQVPPGITAIRVDLMGPMSEQVRAELGMATRVLHFAWDRHGDADGSNAGNLAMLDTLLSACRKGALVFVSSVAGAPDAASSYGRHKLAIANRVLAAGGSVFVPGLVVEDPPAGPYAILTRVIARAPLALRLTSNQPQVYPVAMSRLLDMIVQVADPNLPPGLWRGFEAPVAFNDFLARPEGQHPRRRLPLPIPTRALLGAARMAKALPLPSRAYCDKVLTLLQKNDAYLARIQTLPERKATLE